MLAVLMRLGILIHQGDHLLDQNTMIKIAIKTIASDIQVTESQVSPPVMSISSPASLDVDDEPDGRPVKDRGYLIGRRRARGRKCPVS